MPPSRATASNIFRSPVSMRCPYLETRLSTSDLIILTKIVDRPIPGLDLHAVSRSNRCATVERTDDEGANQDRVDALAHRRRPRDLDRDRRFASDCGGDRHRTLCLHTNSATDDRGAGSQQSTGRLDRLGQLFRLLDRRFARSDADAAGITPLLGAGCALGERINDGGNGFERGDASVSRPALCWRRRERLCVDYRLDLGAGATGGSWTQRPFGGAFRWGR